MKAAVTPLKITSAKDLNAQAMDLDDFLALCTKLTHSFLLPSMDRLEAEGTKLSKAIWNRSHNYSNELMELLHNVKHDWPRESTSVVLNGMLVNTTEEVAGFTEGDICVEQLNDGIKQAHGVNASLEYLERVVPEISRRGPNWEGIPIEPGFETRE